MINKTESIWDKYVVEEEGGGKEEGRGVFMGLPGNVKNQIFRFKCKI